MSKRPFGAAWLAAPLSLALAFSAAAKPDAAAFPAFVAGLWPLAQSHGVSRETFDAAFRGVTFNPAVIPSDNVQAEFVKPIWEYLAGAVSPRRIAAGRANADAQGQWLDKAERTYGVDKAVILGIWGLETDFGGFQGSDSVVRQLASLAFIHDRGDYFRDELIAALEILQAGDVTPKTMKGSWAGAMGQTQFMPSSFLAEAVDFTGEGKRDIWNSPGDAIGSTANYLKDHGWIAGQPWGFEVRLPDSFALKAADSDALAPFSAFAARGVKRADGRALPAAGEGKLFLPAGLKGPALLITENFAVIKTYNNSSSYALAVALLGDECFGRGGIKAAWPTHDRTMSASQLKHMQAKLAAMGYEVGKIDGKVGEQMRAAMRAYQVKLGWPPDGYPTPALLAALDKKA